MRHAVILAGGGGTRLWPASRKDCPKQFLPLGKNDESLLGATAARMRTLTGDRLWVVTTLEQADRVRQDTGLPAERIIAEPEPRNTAAAIGLAAAVIHTSDKDATIGVVPADHAIENLGGFSSTAERAFAAAEDEKCICTIGIVPSHPETGYGYLELASSEAATADVVRFAEKPDLDTAKSYISTGRYRWNAGMFFASTAHLLGELDRYLPKTSRAVRAIAAEPQRAAELYAELEKISFDYAVMEKTSDVKCVSAEFAWSDVGSWDAVAELMESDSSGNKTRGQAVVLAGAGNVVRADPGQVVALYGVSDLAVIQSGNATLVIPKDQAQNVKAIVAELQRTQRSEYL